MSRAPSKRALDAMTMDELVAGIRSRKNKHPYILALLRRDPVEVGRRALELVQQDPSELHTAAFVFQASGGARSPAKDEAAPILKRMLRRKATRLGAIVCLGQLALFSQLRGHRRFLEPKYDYPTRWGATMALADCMMWPLNPGVPDRRAIEGLIIVAKMRAQDSTDFGATYWLVTEYQMNAVPLIGTFLDEVKAGPPNEMQRRVLEDLELT